MEFRFDANQEFQVKAIEAVASVPVCRDVALTDEQAANLALQCNLKTI